MKNIDWQKVKETMAKWKETAAVWWEYSYRFCYIVGVRSMRCLKTAKRFTRLLWIPVWRGIYRAADILLLRYLRAGVGEIRHLWREIRGIKKGETSAFLRSRLFRLVQLPVLAVKRHRKLFITAGNTALPIVALLLLLANLRFWNTAEYALALEYEGNAIGYIADENVYTGAANLVSNTVINADDSFEVSAKPQLTVAIVNKDSLLNEQEVSNRILETLGDRIQHGAGLYVDGVFRGALSSKEKIDALLNARLASQPIGEGETIDFLSQVSVVNGLYPSSAFATEDFMKTYTGALTLKTIRTVVTVEKAPYKTIVQETENLPLGYHVTKVKGKNGTQRVYTQIISVNGKEQYRVVTGTEYIKAPVNQVELVGAQKYDGSAVVGDGVATGIFVWPLPYTKQISSPFAPRWGSFHGAIDIANGSADKKPIIASDGGVVVEATNHPSYGLYVLIDHGNGFKTRYAHCSQLFVGKGDRVAQGQYIAKVGNTGYSTGPHLHFEVIKNGVLVDPLKYVQR